MKPSIVIIGAGGHGKVVYDAILAQNKYKVLGFVDNKLSIGTVVIDKVAVICSQENVLTLTSKVDYFIVAIGDNEARARAFISLIQFLKPATIIHQNAAIGSEVSIGVGTVVLANAIINAMCNIGENTIVNSGVIIDHEANIGNHVYLKLATIVGNNSNVNDYYTSEIGQKITPFSR